MKLSIVIPCYNEEGNVEKLHERIAEELKDIKLEMIFVDDGSKDKTYESLKKVYENDPTRVKVITFSRNFGKEAAMYAGISNSSGEYTCIIDADLQQNPKYLLEMMDYLDKNEECDQVAMVMKKRTVDSGLMRFCKKCFYKLIDSLSDVHFEKDASDFRMFRKTVRDSIVSLGEKNRFSKGIFSWIGYKTKYMTYEVEKRASGVTKFNFKNSVKYAIEGIVGYTVKPLTMSIVAGIISFLAAFIYLLVYLIADLDSAVAPIIIVILFISAIQFIFIGIIGEYIAKSYIEIKQRPIYIARKKLGFEDENIL